MEHVIVLREEEVADKLMQSQFCLASMQRTWSKLHERALWLQLWPVL